MSTVNTILENNLCISCGLCKLVCPAACIEMVWSGKSCWEPVMDKSKCTDCGACLKVCPNSVSNLELSAVKAVEFQEKYGLDDDSDNKFAITWDTNLEKRVKSPSGGTTSTLIEALLERKEVNCAVVARPVSGKIGSPHFETYICYSAEELSESRCSAYGPLRYDLVFEELVAKDENAIVTVLPCIMRGISALPEKYKKHIKYTIGIMCSHCVTDQFGDFMAVKHGIKKSNIFSINYRDNKNIPDANSFNTCFQVDEKKEICTPRWTNGFTTAWRNYFFAREACLYCPDFYVAGADISVKDAWGRLSGEPLGITLAVIRNRELNEKLLALKNIDTIYYEECNVSEIMNSQNSTATFKQIDFISRWKSQKILKKTEIALKVKQNKSVKKDYISKKRTLKRTSKSFEKFGCTFFVCMHKVGGFASKIFSAGKSIGVFLKLLYRCFVAIWGAGIRFLGFREPRNTSFCRCNAQDLKFFEDIENVSDQPESFLKVLITGGYGYGNTGDEAQLGANIRRWKNLNCSIKVFSPNPEYTANHHGVESCWAPRVVLFNSNMSGDYGSSNKNFEKLFNKKKRKMILSARFLRAGINIQFTSLEEAEMLKIIKDADVLHVSGGGFLTGMTRSRLWETALVMRLAHMLGTPVILTGQTIGVFKSKQDKKLAKWGLENASYIYLRDKEESEKDLKAIGISGSHIKSTFDDALFCEKTSDDISDEILKDQLCENGKQYVVANFHYWGQSLTQQKLSSKRFAELCDYIIEKYDLQILFVPMVPSDVEAEQAVVDNMKSKRTSILKYNYDYKVVRGIISNAEFLLTMKHHPIIFAHGEGVPVVCVTLDDYYYRKNLGAMLNCGQEKYCMQADQFFSEDAEKIIDSLYSKLIIERSNIHKYLDSARGFNDEAQKLFAERI